MIVGGIFGGGFLPFGYLMCMIGHGWYSLRCCCSDNYGHTRARLIAETHHNNNTPANASDWVTWVREGIQGANLILPMTENGTQRIALDPCLVLATVSRQDFGLDGEKHVQEWIRKRTDIVVMNQAIMIGTVLCTLGAWGLSFLSGWSILPHDLWSPICILIVVIILNLIIWYVNIIFRIQTDIAIAGMLNLQQR
jgi:hypothetical protein